MTENTIIARVLASVLDVDATAWNHLLAQQSHPTPFLRHEYLAALQESGSATAETGWHAQFMTLWRGATLVAACPLYVKTHSYGEYVFDWAWARAYEEHGVPYYPKAVIAVPFTPVPGTRLMACDEATRALLLSAVCQWCEEEKLSSAHLLFASQDDLQASAQQQLMLRHTVQFHWTNHAPTILDSPAPEMPTPPLAPWMPTPKVPVAATDPECTPDATPHRFTDFGHFLASLSQEKRKKIRQERRKVADAGVQFRWARGAEIRAEDWDFFYRCYERTYLEHGNPPYLTRDFFARMAGHLPEAWVMFTAEREGQPIASSLIAIGPGKTPTNAQNDPEWVAYGRYWGALERVDCLHFEACYYQPLAWCIAQGVSRFEGGAQGEHKMARALLPVQASSAHWLAHPGFADAVARFLQREGEGIDHYLSDLQARNPYKTGPLSP